MILVFLLVALLHETLYKLNEWKKTDGTAGSGGGVWRSRPSKEDWNILLIEVHGGSPYNISLLKSFVNII